MNNRGKKSNINIDVKTVDSGNIEVLVEIPHADPRHTPEMVFSTSDIIRYLKVQNTLHGECIKESMLDNTAPAPVLEGVWIFKKHVKPKVTRAKKSSTVPSKGKATTTSTTKKAKPKNLEEV